MQHDLAAEYHASVRFWILQCVYFGQTGVVREHDNDSCGFNVRGGVRQGCVLSPRLFSSVLEMALSSWRAKMEAEGLSLEDGLKPLLDLRFADDILLFCTTLDKTCLLLDELVASLAQVGLTLNLKKTKILTTQAQPATVTNTWWGDSGCFGPCFYTQMARVFAPCWRLP